MPQSRHLTFCLAKQWRGFFLVIALLCNAFAFADNEVFILHNNDDALKSLLELIQGAKKRIYISKYLFKVTDQSTQQVMKALLDAKRRGVKDIKLLPDAMALGYINSPFAMRYLRYLQDQGIGVRIYRPMSIFDPGSFIYRRMHDKITIVDNVAILGDRNQEDPYFRNESPTKSAEKVYASRDILIKGDAAEAPAQHFLEMFGCKRCKESTTWLNLKPTKKTILAIESAEIPPSNFLKNIADNHLKVASDKIEFVHDNPNTEINEHFKPILDLIGSAEKSIVIENPYFILTKIFQEALSKAAARGVKIITIAPSAEANNVPITDKAFRLISAKFLKKIDALTLTYNGPRFLHMKNIVVDNKVVYIGSYNLDARSQDLNYETGIIVRDPAVATEVMQGITKDMMNSKPINSPDCTYLDWIAVGTTKHLL